MIKKNNMELNIGLIAVILCIVIGIIIATNFYNSNNTTGTNDNYNNTTSSKQKVINTLLKSGYYFDNEKGEYIKSDDDTTTLLNGTGGISNFSFKTNTYSTLLTTLENGNLISMYSVIYDWKKDYVTSFMYSYGYDMYGNSYTQSTVEATISNNNFSCNASTYDCNAIRGLMQIHISEFNDILDNANVTINDLL